MSNLLTRSTPNPAGFRDLGPAELLEGRTTERLIDVREPHEFTGELGHVRGAELVPLATIERAAAGWDRAAPLVVVCRSGGRSSRAAALLAASGFEKVMNLAGGMLAWNDAHLPVER